MFYFPLNSDCNLRGRVRKSEEERRHRTQVSFVEVQRNHGFEIRRKALKIIVSALGVPTMSQTDTDAGSKRPRRVKNEKWKWTKTSLHRPDGIHLSVARNTRAGSFRCSRIMINFRCKRFAGTTQSDPMFLFKLIKGPRRASDVLNGLCNLSGVN